MKLTTVALYPEVKEQLNKIGLRKDSYNDIIMRLLNSTSGPVIKDLKADNRGRVFLGKDFANKRVDISIIKWSEK